MTLARCILPRALSDGSGTAGVRAASVVQGARLGGSSEREASHAARQQGDPETQNTAALQLTHVGLQSWADDMAGHKADSQDETSEHQLIDFFNIYSQNLWKRQLQWA